MEKVKNGVQNLWGNKKGFTLLELLVVIGIIGVLMALATVAYTSTQQSGRNARRKQDLVAIQNALEQYYAANSFSYPDGTCRAASVYMKSAWPLDPDTELDYSGATICTPTSYCIYALMEGQAGTAGNCTAGCNWTGGKDYYCVGNLQ